MESPRPARHAGRHAAAGAPDAGFHPQRVARHSDRELRGALASRVTQEPDLRRVTGPFPVLTPQEDAVVRRVTGPMPILTPDTSWAAAGPTADQAMVRLYRRNFTALVRLATFLVRDTATAEEVVQDAFINMHRGWHRLRDEENALAYLRQAVVNRARSVLRHRVIVERNAPKAMPDLPSAEDGAISMFERSAVIDALRDLPGRQREALSCATTPTCQKLRSRRPWGSARAQSRATPPAG